MPKPETMRFRAATTVVEPSPTGEADCRRLAQQIIASWKKNGAEVDATVALKQYPDLGRYKSVVLDLAYEEYCLRTERGEAVSSSRFCQRFPDYQRSVLEQIKVAHLLSANGDFLENLATAIWPQPGDIVAGYEIVDELGRGAFARVYLATEQALGGRQVAIKVSRHGTAKAEADMLGKLDHPNVVPVHSVQRDDETGLTVICMPYLGRATLCDVLDAAVCETTMPRYATSILGAVREVNGDDVHRNGAEGAHRLLYKGTYVDGVLHLGGQLAEALAYAHSTGNSGILHLDLKPSNVLVTSDGVPMLLDFNLSTDEQNGDQPLGGTLPYMSPEQLRRFSSSGRNGVEIDHRSDVFSLGVILYELLCGQLPCGDIPDDLTTKELADYLMQRGGARPLRSMNSAIDGRVAGVIDRCLASDPRDRPQTAAELATDLRRELSVNQRARRQARAHPVIVIVVLLSILVLCGSVAFYFATRDPYPIRQRTAGIQAFEDDDYEAALVYLNTSIKEQPTTEAFSARARVLAQLRDTDAAIRDLDAARAIGVDKSRFKEFARQQFELGQAAFNAGQYDTALHHLRISIVADDSSTDAMFLRGRTYVKLKDFPGAAHDVEQSLKTAPSPRRMAYLGYCWNMAKQHRLAIRCYESAIEEGLRSAVVYNNLGYSHLRTNRRTSALVALSEAIELDDHFPPALHNRALTKLELARADVSKPAKPLTYLRSALADIEAAISLGHPTGELYVDAAEICAAGLTLSPSWTPPPNAYLKHAMECGANSAKLKASETFSPFFATDTTLNDVSMTSNNYKSKFIVDPDFELSQSGNE